MQWLIGCNGWPDAMVDWCNSWGALSVENSFTLKCYRIPFFRTIFWGDFLDNREGECKQSDKPRAMRLSALCLCKHLYYEIFPESPFGLCMPPSLGGCVTYVLSVICLCRIIASVGLGWGECTLEPRRPNAQKFGLGLPDKYVSVSYTHLTLPTKA